ncbi:MAG: hypothetical protein HY238_02820 [Acidobacteria bacterium]|nr:hypothetical protein [Acidobacteriota bacterium]
MIAGYLTLAVACLGLWAFMRFRLRAATLARRHISILIYIALSLAIFYHGALVTAVALGDRPENTFLSWRFQVGLAMLAGITVAQACIVVFTGSLFWRALAPSLFLFVSSPLLLHFVGLGIINLVWSTIFGGTQSALLLVTTLFASLSGGISQAALLEDETDR